MNFDSGYVSATILTLIIYQTNNHYIAVQIYTVVYIYKLQQALLLPTIYNWFIEKYSLNCECGQFTVQMSLRVIQVITTSKCIKRNSASKYLKRPLSLLHDNIYIYYNESDYNTVRFDGDFLVLTILWSLFIYFFSIALYSSESHRIFVRLPPQPLYI